MSRPAGPTNNHTNETNLLTIKSHPLTHYYSHYYYYHHHHHHRD